MITVNTCLALGRPSFDDVADATKVLKLTDAFSAYEVSARSAVVLTHNKDAFIFDMCKKVDIFNNCNI
jgi:hypothetical protein